MRNMSNRTLNLQWVEAMQAIKDLVNEEQVIESDQGGEGAAGGGRAKKSKIKKKKPPTPEEAFDCLARLYIRYHQVLAKLERCYDGIVQPQKRQDIRVTLELIVCRTISLRRSLVELVSVISDSAAAGNGSKKKNSNENFPRPFPECIDISNILQSMGLSPFDMETIVPRYFKEESVQLRRQMDLQMFKPSTDDNRNNEWSYHEAPKSAEATITEKKVDVEDGEEAEESKDAEDNVRVDDSFTSSQPENNKEKTDTCTRSRSVLSDGDAAIKVQSFIRGSMSRNHTKKHRRQEADSVGMAVSRNSSNRRKTLQQACDHAYTRKKEIQLESAETYQVGLGDLRDTLRQEEGYELRERLYRERMQWIADQIDAAQSIPESLEAFYIKHPTNAEGSDDVNAASAEISSDKNGTAPANERNQSDKRASPSEESSDNANDNVQQLLRSLAESVYVFESRWKGWAANDHANATQGYDEDLAKDLFIRKEVESVIVQDVDKSVLAYLQRMNGGGVAKSIKNKGKEGAVKKKGGKSGKKGGKKEKLLPGDKIVGSMSTLDMLRHLSNSCLVSDSSCGQVGDLIGSPDAFNPPLLKVKTVASSGVTKAKAAGDNESFWNRSNPSTNQLKSSIIEYCILPNGSSTVKDAIADEDNVRSIMFYGPPGCGKSSMVDAVAHHLGALLIKLSPQLLQDVYLDKSESTGLIHMIFAIARDERYGPVVIHIEECDQFFLPASGKHPGKQINMSGVIRFQKDLLTYKNRALKKNDRVIIIGTTTQPDIMDQKIVAWKGASGKPERQGFFEKFLYFPAPGYVDRLMIWKAFANKKVDCMVTGTTSEQVAQILHGLDFSLLARVSKGYTAGSIRKTIDHVFTSNRLECISSGKPKSLEEELLTHLKNSEHAVHDEDDMRFVGFARAMHELNAVRRDGANDNKGKVENAKKK